ncbi:hypothetical protein [Deinococcus yunweiensis]|uniref:hypothetical protein n=1 Tax=Deinococcus yunweiensis TaxID=367282 RepID=UPI00398EA845
MTNDTAMTTRKSVLGTNARLPYRVTAFLPKPQVMLDDQPVGTWRRLVQIHPLSCAGGSVDTYRAALSRSRPE